MRMKVSITTVSHVINKTRHVNQETRAAVVKAMEELEYRRRTTMQPNRIQYIGVIIADVREDYYIAVVKAIETVATDFGISIVFCDSEDDADKEEKNIKMLIDRKVDGLICAASTIGYELVSVLDDLDTDVQRRMRVVSCDDNRWFDYLKFPISVISQPTAEIGSAAVENLLQLIEQKHSPPAVKRELFFDVNLIDRLD